jgi:hypothetical protein
MSQRCHVEGIGVSLTLGLPDSLLALLDDFIGCVVGPANDDRAVRSGGRHDECSEERNEEGEDGEAHYVCLVKEAESCIVGLLGCGEWSEEGHEERRSVDRRW